MIMTYICLDHASSNLLALITADKSPQLFQNLTTLFAKVGIDYEVYDNLSAWVPVLGGIDIICMAWGTLPRLR